MIKTLCLLIMLLVNPCLAEALQPELRPDDTGKEINPSFLSRICHIYEGREEAEGVKSPATPPYSAPVEAEGKCISGATGPYPRGDGPGRSLAEVSSNSDGRSPGTDGPVGLAQDGTAQEDGDGEEPIGDAFVHSLTELDDLTIPLDFRKAVKHYIVYFTVTKRKMFTSWLRRAERYTPLLRKILKDHGLPDDLVYLAMIESGFNPRAYSRMRASGTWQLIAATGTRYGLRIDHWVDERRDVEKATVAAARYLKDLFDQFGCWYLAASGYNAGEGRIEKAIRRYRTSDYWKLYGYNTLPRETREYIPQLIAAATIAEDPLKYGFDVDDEQPYEVRKRPVPGGTPLRLVALASRTELSEVRSLNPALLRLVTPPGKRRYVIKLPKDASLGHFEARLYTSLKRCRRPVKARLAVFRRIVKKAAKRYRARAERTSRFRDTKKKTDKKVFRRMKGRFKSHL